MQQVYTDKVRGDAQPAGGHGGVQGVPVILKVLFNSFYIGIDMIAVVRCDAPAVVVRCDATT